MTEPKKITFKSITLDPKAREMLEDADRASESPNGIPDPGELEAYMEMQNNGRHVEWTGANGYYGTVAKQGWEYFDRKGNPKLFELPYLLSLSRKIEEAHRGLGIEPLADRRFSVDGHALMDGTFNLPGGSGFDFHIDLFQQYGSFDLDELRIEYRLTAAPAALPGAERRALPAKADSARPPAAPGIVALERTPSPTEANAGDESTPVAEPVYETKVLTHKDVITSKAGRKLVTLEFGKYTPLRSIALDLETRTMTVLTRQDSWYTRNFRPHRQQVEVRLFDRGD